MRRRVVITGLGTLSCAGANLDEARASFAAGACCLSPINDPRIAHLKARYAGLVRNFDAAKSDLPAELRPFDKHILMAFVAAREALSMSGVSPIDLGRRLGLIFSTCSGPMLLIEAHYERIIRGDRRITAEELFAKRYYSGAPILARALGIQGMTTTVATACTAGTAAIALAADLIRCGLLDAALAGGSDAFSTSTLAGFDGLKATTEGKCAPFSKPFGLNLGEAASFVFLETIESARDRGARIRAEIAGSGMSNDAYHCSSPEPTGRGLAAAMQRALEDAGLAPDQISYINAHGTGTEANDKAETRAIRKVFGARAEQVPISSTKSMVGHCLGAAGTLEAVASIACAEAGVFPPTANFIGPREGCTLDYIPEPGRPWAPPRTFLSNNLAFGGHNASLVVSMPAAADAPAPARTTAQACTLHASGRREQRASGSPSPPLEERAGERRPVTILDAAARGDNPAGCRTNISGVLAENDDLLFLPLPTNLGSPESCPRSPLSPSEEERAEERGPSLPGGSGAQTASDGQGALSSQGGEGSGAATSQHQDACKEQPPIPYPDVPICVTACGLVSSLGIGASALLDAITRHRSGTRPVLLPGLAPIPAGMVNEEAVEKFDRRLDLRNMDRSSRWATVATRLAMREAGFPEKPAALADLGFFLHLSAGPSWAESEFLTSFLGHDHQVSQLVAFPFIVPCSVAGNVCRALRLTGHNLTLSAGPGAGLLGLGPAVAALRSGHTQALLSGAVDELSERILTDNFMAGLVAKDGIPPGEGAAVLLLETVPHAEARGAKPLATIRGLAFSTEVVKALEETVHEALAQASVAPEQVSAVCACGPRSRIEPLIARICPAWAKRIVAVSQHTGCAEGSQPLFDLAAALLAPPENPARPPFILAIVSTPPGSNGVVVFQRALAVVPRG